MTRTDTLYERLLEENPGNFIHLEEMLHHAQQMERKLDEARSELSLKQQTLTIAEGTLSDLRKQRDEWEAMCGRYKQERDIAEEDATNYHARIIELIAERDKTKQERDEAWAMLDRSNHFLQQVEENLESIYKERDEARERCGKLQDISESAINLGLGSHSFSLIQRIADTLKRRSTQPCKK